MKSSSLFILLCLVVFTACSSIPKVTPKETEPLNYSKPDVVQNESERIREYLKEDVTKALFRAWLLQDETVLNECVRATVEQAEKLFSEKKYSECYSYAKSLFTLGFEDKLTFTLDQVQSELYKNVPGLKNLGDTKSSKIATTLSECVNATVTVWVDKGIKVTYGAGVSDTVLGSGFFIDENGYIITNHHVIADLVDPSYEDYVRLYIKLASDSDTKYPAKVVGYDPVMDLALLKTEVEVPYILELDDSKALNTGDKVVVIGSPMGLEASVSQGIISSTERTLFTQGKVFQLDASVNPGNSGGPCIGNNLKVQAVTFAQITNSQGLNFAIPVEYLIQELPYLYNGGEFSGEYKHSWIAGYGRNRRTGNSRKGVDVWYVIPGGTAVYSGLKKGDVITWCDGVTIDSLDTLQSVFRRNGVGTILKMKVVDEVIGEKDVFVFLEKRSNKPATVVMESDLLENAFIPLYGMKLTHSSTNSKKTYTIDWVIPGSYADESKFSENDIISINDFYYDKDRDCIVSTVLIKQRKSGFLDISMVIAVGNDSPYFF